MTPETRLWEARSQNLTAAATGGQVAATYRLTNRYLYVTSGVINETTQPINLTTIENVVVRSGLIHKARGLFDAAKANATLLTGTTTHVLANNATPTWVPGTGPAAAPALGAPAPVPAVEAEPSAEQIMATLRQLGELRDAGIVTAEEFDAKKAELLARL